MADAIGWIVIATLTFLLTIILVLRSLKIIQPFQQGIVTIWGSYKGTINPGVSFLNPLAGVIRVDLRTQSLLLRLQDVETKDHAQTNLEAVLQIRIVDSAKAVFAVHDYRTATLELAGTAVRSVVAETPLFDLLNHRDVLTMRLQEALSPAVDRWGVTVETVALGRIEH